MQNMYEVEGETKVNLTPELKKLVESGQITRDQALRIMQEQGQAPRLLTEG